MPIICMGKYIINVQDNMNKKSNPKAQLNKIITQKCFEVHPPHDQQAIFQQCLAQSSFNMNRGGLEYKGRRSKLQAYAHDIINKLHLHERYCDQLFQMEIKKYEDYYTQVMQMIDEQYEKGKFFIEKERQKISKLFELEKSRILNFKKELQISEKYKSYDYQDRIRIFQHSLNLQVNIIRVNVPKIQAFSKDIHKYFIHYQQMNPYSQQSTHVTLSANYNQTQQVEAPESIDPQSPQPHNQTDELLCCDQQLGAKAGANTIRRRKYDVGRQNVIKQEDESDDTNSIVSDS